MKKLLLFSLVTLSFNLNSLNDFTFLSFREIKDPEVGCVIICPADIVVTLDPGACEVEISYPVTYSMCSGSIVQTSGLPTGSTFPIGTTTNCFQIQTETCCFNVTVNEYPTPTTTLACNDNVQVSVDDNCEAFIATDEILEGGPYKCYNDYIVAVQGYGSGFGGVSVNSNAVGQTLSVTVTDPETGNSCFGTISVEDKTLPIITCPPTVNSTGCGIIQPNITGYATAIDNCTNNPLITWTDEEVMDVCPGIGSGIFRTWIATDESGNSAGCLQQIGERCQARQITFYDITNNSISLEWINGNGDNRIVIMNTSNSFTLPINGLDYDADPDYDPPGEQVVFNGNDNFVTVTNLEANTTYWFRVYEEYCAESSPVYYTPTATGNPKSQITNGGANPSSVVPNTILSPVPCVSTPGLFQSNLPEDLYEGMCTPRFKCKPESTTIWNQSVPPAYQNNKNSCELIPFAYDCFNNLSNNWEFRQRGFITDPPGNGCLSCGNLPACNRVSHSNFSCYDKDDRYAWDINLAGSTQDCGIYVYSIAEGDACKVGTKAVMIRHTNNSAYWYSWYDNIDIYGTLNLPPCTGSINNFNPCIQNSFKNLPANTRIGDIANAAAHLHFGVYDEVNCELVSRNRPIDPSYFDINGDHYDISDIQGYCTGSIVSNASVYFQKDGVWHFGGKTDDAGRFKFLTIPGLKAGDSLSISASGFLPVQYKISIEEENVISMNIPLIEKQTTLIKNPTVTNLTNSTFSRIPILPLKITGENYLSYDVVQVIHFEDTTILTPITSNVPYVDSIYNLIFPDTGRYQIGVIFKGVNEEIVQKEFIYNPDNSNSFYLKILSDLKYVGARLFVDNKYLKQLDLTLDSIELLSGEHIIDISMYGYNSNLYIVNNDEDEIIVNLTPNKESLIEYSDTTLYNFVTDGAVLHRRNVTLVDTTQTLIVSLIQSYPDFTHLALTPKSREFRFGNSVFPNWSTFSFASLLNQIDPVCADSVYILRILDDSLYSKRYFSANNSNEIYDSSFQKLFLKENSFGFGQAKEESIILMAKQAPRRIEADTFQMLTKDSILVALTSLFVDPDSITNDLLYHLPDSLPLSVEVSFRNDSLFILSSLCEADTITFSVTAEHDGLLAHSTVTLVIDSLEKPIINVSGDQAFCKGETALLSSSNASTYLWNNGATSQTILIDTDGIYFLTISDALGCEKVSDPVQITVYENPVVDLGPDTIITSKPILLDAGNPNASFAWNTGDTTQTIVANNAGTFLVIVTDGNDCTNSDTVYVDFSTSNILLEGVQGIKVYPNPNFGVFHLEYSLNNPEKLRYEIYDPIGRLAVTDLTESTSGRVNTMISIPNATSGIYYLRLRLGSNSHVIKLVVL